MNILCIEDNKAMGEVMLDLLMSVGHDVAWLTKRPSEINLSSFDLVISDYEVPGVSFEHTQKQCEKKRLPLLLVSGTVFAEVPHNHYLPKPFHCADLLNSIKKATLRKFA